MLHSATTAVKNSCFAPAGARREAGSGRRTRRIRLEYRVLTNGSRKTAIRSRGAAERDREAAEGDKEPGID